MVHAVECWGIASDGARPAGAPEAAVDTGMAALVTLLGFYEIPADPHQLAREFASSGCALTSTALIRAARANGLKARASKSNVNRLAKLPLPAIIRDRTGAYVILAKAGPASVLVKEAGLPPTEWTLAELEQRWSGEIIFVTRRSSLNAEVMKFGLGWFLPVISRYRGLFTEVLVISFFLQVFGLVAPLFSQVIIDKVLVHRGLTTLDILVVGLAAIGTFEIVLGGLRTYIFSHTTSRIDAPTASSSWTRVSSSRMVPMTCW